MTVQEFISACRGKIPLETAGGERGLDRRISEPAINRPGLALAGMYRHFPFRRIQLMGMAEMEYIRSLSKHARSASLSALFQKPIPCVVLSRNRRVPADFKALSEKRRVPLLRTSMITWNFMNNAASLLESLMSPSLAAQGTMVDIMGIGVLLEGRPRVGKSEAALALVKRGHSLVADDVTMLRHSGYSSLLATAKPATRYHIEIRGLGIIHVPSLFGVASVRDEKTLDLIVTLRRIEELEEGGLGLTQTTRTLLGVPIPHITLPVAPGRELANIIEVAALNEKLKRLGHDAAKELDDKLMRLMAKRNTG